MMSFSKDTDFARSIPARISAYSVSLLDAGKPSLIACYILSLIGALSCNPIPAPRLARSVVHIKDPPASVILFHIWSG